jgi:hypothetical protein
MHSLQEFNPGQGQSESTVSNPRVPPQRGLSIMADKKTAFGSGVHTSLL